VTVDFVLSFAREDQGGIAGQEASHPEGVTETAPIAQAKPPKLYETRRDVADPHVFAIQVISVIPRGIALYGGDLKGTPKIPAPPNPPPLFPCLLLKGIKEAIVLKGLKAEQMGHSLPYQGGIDELRPRKHIGQKPPPSIVKTPCLKFQPDLLPQGQAFVYLGGFPVKGLLSLRGVDSQITEDHPIFKDCGIAIDHLYNSMTPSFPR